MEDQVVVVETMHIFFCRHHHYHPLFPLRLVLAEQVELDLYQPDRLDSRPGLRAPQEIADVMVDPVVLGLIYGLRVVVVVMVVTQIVPDLHVRHHPLIYL
jgi:hypothetical protein